MPRSWIPQLGAVCLGNNRCRFRLWASRARHVDLHLFENGSDRILKMEPRGRGYFESQKLAAGAMLLAPYLPLLFMGEEYGETAPFLYFVDFSDPNLVEAVRRGRKEEFGPHGGDDPPDPQSEETFRRSKLRPEAHTDPQHRVLREFYKELLCFRRESSVLRFPDKDQMRVTPFMDQRTLVVER
jgi:maltooligosyltrehalose trehalohydrolase